MATVEARVPGPTWAGPDTTATEKVRPMIVQATRGKRRLRPPAMLSTAAITTARALSPAATGTEAAISSRASRIDAERAWLKGAPDAVSGEGRATRLVTRPD
ncbi:hypothetical protein [Brachybacterium muris]|uniref:hypothetical protein n=1 Tax=Brachybacterium muris TaxID=219301 RepID=UPI00223BC491|nr:hypothetical protein [Brachybacterium muris]MCT1654376.1 hypothetical protein [Brachybacterium muris]MCT2177471.1 hypothetical protein [Brachybacterium muris]